MKVISLLSILLLAGFTITAQTAGVRSEYDKSQDQTRIMGSFIPVVPQGKSAILFTRIDIVGGLEYPGEKLLADSKDFHLAFAVQASDWRYLSKESRQLIINADGKRFTYPDGERSGRETKLDGKAGTAELVSFLVPRKDFEAIANAKVVELQLGSLESVLSDAAKASLIEILGAGTASLGTKN